MVLLALFGCGVGQGAEPHSSHDRSVLVDARARTYLEAVSATLAQEFVGPDGRPFEVRLRTPEIESFPCASCHGGEDGRSEARRSPGHRDVGPVHPRTAAGDCGTCHRSQDPAMLRLATGESTSLDHAYRLCARCHFEQAEAWAGGAHGKRVATWEGRRVVLNCTRCHNPHSPAFPKRWPRPGPSLPRRSR